MLALNVALDDGRSSEDVRILTSCQLAPAVFATAAILVLCGRWIWTLYNPAIALANTDIVNDAQGSLQRSENETISAAAEDEKVEVEEALGILGLSAELSAAKEWQSNVKILEAVLSSGIAVCAVCRAVFTPKLPEVAVAISTVLIPPVTLLRILSSSKSFTFVTSIIFYTLLLISEGITFRIKLQDAASSKELSALEYCLLPLSVLQFGLLLFKPIGDPRVKRPNSDAPPEIGDYSLFQYATLSNLTPMIFRAMESARKGAAPMLRPEAFAAAASSDFRMIQLQHPTWGLKWRLFWYFKKDMALQQVYGIPGAFAKIGPPFFLRFILQYIAAKHSSSKDVLQTRDVGIFFAVLMAGSQLLRALFAAKVLLIGRQMCVKMRAILSSEVYAKVLRRQEFQADQDSEEASTPGKVSNLISTDVFRTSEVFAYLHQLVPEGILQIVVGLVLLFATLGPSAWAALAVLLLQLPFQAVLGRLYNSFSASLLEATDARLNLMQEVIHAIRIVKFFAWEDSFSRRLSDLRSRELGVLIRRMVVDVSIKVHMMAGSIMVAVATFYVHAVWRVQPLDAATAFTSLALLNILRDPLDDFSAMIIEIIRANVSMNRIRDFLDEPDTAKWSILQATEGQSRIGFSNATFDYGRRGDDDVNFVLEDLSLDFPIGRLSIVVGSVGSGKSTLLLSLLGETRLLSGKVHLASSSENQARSTASVAYCAQAPYLLSDSVRNNIVFGAAWDEGRYRRVLEACALLPDLAQFDAGDQTQIGEKGTVLSGGQKARLALARAIYSSARIVLLDDVIAAVDAHTAQHLLKTLTGPLLQGRTVILVTHALHLFMSTAEYMVVLEGGVVLYAGEPKAAPPDLALPSIEIPVDDAEPHSVGAVVASDAKSSLDKVKDDLAPLEGKAEARKVEENQESGAVSREVYFTYFRSIGSWAVWVSVLVLYIIGQAAETLSSAWLAVWVNSFDAKIRQILARFASAAPRPFAMLSQDQHDTIYYFNIYLGLSLLTILFHFLRTAWYLYRGINGARTLYTNLSRSIIGARIKFFDATPVGRIVNRLSRDTSVIDQDISNNISFLLWETVASLAIFAAIVAGMPLFVPIAIPIGWFYIKLTTIYLVGSREFKRAESTTRSPIFGAFGETMAGVVTIRAYADTARFMRRLFTLQNTNSRPFYALWISNRWVCMRTDLGSCFITLIVALYVVLSDNVSAALAGFVMSYVLSFQGRLLWLARQTAALEIDANSIERVKEYIDLDQEPKRGLIPSESWPSQDGAIRVEKLSARYAPDLAPVLRNVSFVVGPKMKVAIVGRTGSGKSTLALSFFRFIEADSGRIEIDGLDISQISLKALRSKLTIIAQDAVLFTGTIRFNLDPFNQHSDADLWDALRRVNMITQTPGPTPRPSRPATPRPSRPASIINVQRSGHMDIASANANLEDLEEKVIIKSLDQAVTEGGKNFSAGQRSLLALARGLLKLKTSRILILDEASASLDAKTDEQVQRTIRTEMQDATILCIAHRLSTIIDYDRVLVLAHGEVLEYDTPHNLLEKQDSAFTALCKNTGETEYQSLREAARKSQNMRTANTKMK